MQKKKWLLYKSNSRKMHLAKKKCLIRQLDKVNKWFWDLKDQIFNVIRLLSSRMYQCLNADPLNRKYQLIRKKNKIRIIENKLPKGNLFRTRSTRSMNKLPKSSKNNVPWASINARKLLPWIFPFEIKLRSNMTIRHLSDKISL